MQIEHKNVLLDYSNSLAPEKHIGLGLWLCLYLKIWITLFLCCSVILTKLVWQWTHSTYSSSFHAHCNHQVDSIHKLFPRTHHGLQAQPAHSSWEVCIYELVVVITTSGMLKSLGWSKMKVCYLYLSTKKQQFLTSPENEQMMHTGVFFFFN